MSQTSTARHTEFKLLRYFTSASLVAFLVAAASSGLALVLFSLAGPLVSAETREAQVLPTRSLGPVGMATAG